MLDTYKSKQPGVGAIFPGAILLRPFRTYSIVTLRKLIFADGFFGHFARTYLHGSINL